MRLAYRLDLLAVRGLGLLGLNDSLLRTAIVSRRQDALEAYRYATLPTWRIIAPDDTLFVSTFDVDWEGYESPVYRIDVATGGALYGGFRCARRRPRRHGQPQCGRVTN